MGWNTYSNSDYQRANGYNGRYQMGYQRIRRGYPLLRMGGQYGIVQDGNQEWPLVAAGSGRKLPSSKYVPAETQDNAWRSTKTIAPVGAWKKQDPEGGQGGGNESICGIPREQGRQRGKSL